MLTAVVFVHLQRLCVTVWNSDSIRDSSAIASRISIRRDVRVYFNEFSERYTVDTGFGIFECDAVGIADRWVYELTDTVILPEFYPDLATDATKLRCAIDSERLGLYYLSDIQMDLMVRMKGRPVPFRPDQSSEHP